jgi:(E)-4-hydroxy-3-methylbut-2-enyl-diphosphate synthase
MDGTESTELIKTLATMDPIVALLNTAAGESRLHSSRRVFEVLKANNIETPVVHHRFFDDSSVRDEIVITTGSEVGGLLCDGMGDGLLLEVPSEEVEYLRNTSFGLLQVLPTPCIHKNRHQHVFESHAFVACSH